MLYLHIRVATMLIIHAGMGLSQVPFHRLFELLHITAMFDIRELDAIMPTYTLSLPI